MSPEKLLAIAVVLLFVVCALLLIVRRLPRRMNHHSYVSRWREIQKLCGNKDTWPLAIINADSLLDEAMKKKRIAGKTMGERLVSAQKTFSNNDGVWFAHKLRNKLVHEDTVKLKESDVKNALLGIRQALKDIGAFK